MKKPTSKEYILSDAIYATILSNIITEIECRLVAARVRNRKEGCGYKGVTPGISW